MRRFLNAIQIITVTLTLAVANLAHAKSDVHEIVESIARQCAEVVIDIHHNRARYAEVQNKKLAFEVATNAAVVFESMKESLTAKRDKEAAQQRLDECKVAFAKEFAKIQ